MARRSKLLTIAPAFAFGWPRWSPVWLLRQDDAGLVAATPGWVIRCDGLADAAAALIFGFCDASAAWAWPFSMLYTTVPRATPGTLLLLRMMYFPNLGPVFGTHKAAI